MHENQKSPRILGVIPARYNSSRFPGKPLIKIRDKTMLQRVYEQAKKSKLEDVIIATDDIRISQEVLSWGCNATCILTKTSHQSGTDRMFEAIEKYGGDFDGYINIQGDEPFIDPNDVDKIHNSILAYQDLRVIITLVEDLAPEHFSNRNVVKAIVDGGNNISGFFRSVIFYPNTSIFRHIGIYGMSHKVMLTVKDLVQSENEVLENLEQIRWLDNGILMFCEKSENKSIGIDTPADLEKVLNP